MTDYGKNKALKGIGYYSEWPKVADAVIKAVLMAFSVHARVHEEKTPIRTGCLAVRNDADNRHRQALTHGPEQYGEAGLGRG